MNGVHPFSCRVVQSQSSVAAPQPIDNIEKGICPFLQNVPGLIIPVYAPEIVILPPKMQDLFALAFSGKGNSQKSGLLGRIFGGRQSNQQLPRPTPAEWHGMLKDLQSQLKNCSNVTHHQYYSALSSCPWCEADAAYQNMLGTGSSSASSAISQTMIAPPPPAPPIAPPKAPPQTTANTVRYYGRDKTILLVDDAAFMRMMLKDILVANGYTVIGEAENGVKAIEKYKELKPNLVIMDITMPEMDGIQASKGIKAVDSGALIVMCSNMGQQAMVIESIQAGARDFIVKPFTAARVIESVKGVIG